MNIQKEISFPPVVSVDNEKAIRSIVARSVSTFARTFAQKHLSEINKEDGIINSKMNNGFIAVLGSDIQYYSALCRSLDSSLGNMLETLAINIAKMHYKVTQKVQGILYKSQTDYIAELLEVYKNTKGTNHKKPSIADYKNLIGTKISSSQHSKRHDSDYYLYDEETGMHYLIELKIGGDLDNKKARSEKEALLEQYCILANTLGSEEKIKLYFATAYNRYGEEKPWVQGRVLQFFAKEELLISKDFWNLVCKSEHGYEIVIDEYKKCSPMIVDALKDIKNAYLPENE